MKVFSVHDIKAETYLQPIFFKTAGEAIRGFQTACKDINSNFHAYPADFTLVELGEFNSDTGLITSHQIPRILSNASEWVVKETTPDLSMIKNLSKELLESRN